MLRTSYKHLNNIQKGWFGATYSKLAFTLEGFEVYSSEYDDRGVDFVIRNKSGQFFSVQVKTTIDDTANPFIKKDKFHSCENFIFCAVRIIEGMKPTLYITRGSDWNSNKYECLNYNPNGGGHGPYYEICFASKYKDQLKDFEFQTYIERMRA